MRNRQEQAYEYVTETFLKLLQQDKRIGAEHKKSVLAFYKDMFEHEGVRNNMIQAFSNFLGEVDRRIDASRKAGIASVKEALLLQARSNGTMVSDNGNIIGKLDIDLMDTIHLINVLLDEENSHEETLTDDDIANTDLTEVGGGDEDDTPLI